MSVLSGGVNVTVRVDGAGNAPAKVDDTTKAIDRVKASADKTSSSVTTLKDRMGAIKGAVGPVNLVRETFENLRGNLGLVGAAIGGVVGIFGTLFDLLSGDDTLSDYAQEMIDSAHATLELSKQLAQVGAKAREAAKDVDALRKSTAQMRAANARAKGDEDKADFIERQGRTEDAVANKEEAEKDRDAAFIAQRQALGALRDAKEEAAKTKADLAMLDARIEGRVAGVDPKQEGDTQAMVEKRAALLNLTLNIGQLTKDVEHLGDTYKELQGQVQEFNETADNAVVVNMPELQVVDSKKGKGSGPKEDPREKLRKAFLTGDQKAIDEAYAQDRGGGTKLAPANDNTSISDLDPMALDGLAKTQEQIDKYIAETARIADSHALGDPIRDFAAALSEALPGMSEFSGALGEISQMWGDYAETGKGAARATIMSVGAIAMAGAEQIKNEQLRAGVLSLIHLGLGTALMFVPGAQQEAYGHLAGAAILGLAAGLGGSKSGGGGSRAGAPRSVNRPLSDRTESGGWTVNVFGGWFGTTSPQETAAALHSLTQRGGGSGYVPARAA